MPLVITKTVDEEHLKIAGQLVREALQRALDAARGRIQGLAAKYTPVQSGTLLRSFSVDVEADKIVVRWNTPYATAIEVGRDEWVVNPGGPYPLKFPNRKGGLQKAGRPGKRKFIPPRDGFIRSWGLLHPGWTGRYYGESTGNEGILILQEELARALEEQEMT